MPSSHDTPCARLHAWPPADRVQPRPGFTLVKASPCALSLRQRRLKDIPGSSVEHNNFCVSAHFRNCPGEAWQDVISTVEDIVSQHGDLRMTRGRKVVEIRPKVGAYTIVRTRIRYWARRLQSGRG